MLPPGQDATALGRAREICFLLRAQGQPHRGVAQAADRAYQALEILLSSRRWKQEADSLDSLRKQIKSACDRLRVAVEGELSQRPAV